MLPEIDGLYSIGMCQIIKYKNILQIFLGQRWRVLLAHHERHDTEGGPAHRRHRQPGEDADTISTDVPILDVLTLVIAGPSLKPHQECPILADIRLKF